MDQPVYPSAGLALIFMLSVVAYRFLDSRPKLKSAIFLVAAGSWAALAVFLSVWGASIQWHRGCVLCAAFTVFVFLPILLVPPFLMVNSRYRFFGYYKGKRRRH